jgi:hypothetical protein
VSGSGGATSSGGTRAATQVPAVGDQNDRQNRQDRAIDSQIINKGICTGCDR